MKVFYIDRLNYLVNDEIEVSEDIIHLIKEDDIYYNKLFYINRTFSSYNDTIPDYLYNLVLPSTDVYELYEALEDCYTIPSVPKCMRVNSYMYKKISSKQRIALYLNIRDKIIYRQLKLWGIYNDIKESNCTFTYVRNCIKSNLYYLYMLSSKTIKRLMLSIYNINVSDVVVTDSNKGINLFNICLTESTINEFKKKLNESKLFHAISYYINITKQFNTFVPIDTIKIKSFKIILDSIHKFENRLKLYGVSIVDIGNRILLTSNYVKSELDNIEDIDIYKGIEISNDIDKYLLHDATVSSIRRLESELDTNLNIQQFQFLYNTIINIFYCMNIKPVIYDAYLDDSYEYDESVVIGSTFDTCLIGSAGTGKSITIKILSTILKRYNINVGVFTYTGVASERLHIAKIKSHTCHTMLSSIDTGNYNVILFDESSFLTPNVVMNMIKSIDLYSLKSIIYVGDINQLPPVCAPVTLFDSKIRSCSKLIELTKIYRYKDEDNNLIKSLQRTKTIDSIKEYLNIETIEDNKTAEDRCIEEYVTFIKDKYIDFIHNMKKMKLNELIKHPYIQGLKQLQILSYTNKVRMSINSIIRKRLAKRYSIIGSYVMVLDNSITNSIKNGSFCIVIDKDKYNYTLLNINTNKICKVEIKYFRKGKDYDDAFCITIHKSQSMEWKNIIINLVDNCKSKELNLIYTAITRYRDSCTILCKSNMLKSKLKPSPITTKVIDELKI